MWPGLQLRSPDTIPRCDWSMPPPPTFVMVVHQLAWLGCSASCHDQCLQSSFWRHRSLQADELGISWAFTCPSRFIVFPCSGQGASPNTKDTQNYGKLHLHMVKYYKNANNSFGLTPLVPVNPISWISPPLRNIALNHVIWGPGPPKLIDFS